MSNSSDLFYASVVLNKIFADIPAASIASLAPVTQTASPVLLTSGGSTTVTVPVLPSYAFKLICSGRANNSIGGAHPLVFVNGQQTSVDTTAYATDSNDSIFYIEQICVWDALSSRLYFYPTPRQSGNNPTSNFFSVTPSSFQFTINGITGVPDSGSSLTIIQFRAESV